MTALEKIQDLRRRALCSTLVIVLLLLPFFRPPSFFSMNSALGDSIDLVYTAWKALAMLLIGLLFLARPRLSPVTVVLAAYNCLTLVTTLINHSPNSIFDCINHTVSIGAVCVLADIASDEDPKALVKGLFFSLGALCLINLATVLLVRGGADLYSGQLDHYFLGLDNSHGFFIVPLLPAAMLYAWNRRWPLAGQIALLAVFTVSVYITWPASGVVSVSAFLALFFIWRLRRCRQICNIGVFYGVLAAIFLLVVVLQATEWFAFIFEDILHKDVTLSARTDLWARCLQVIRAKPILGNGLYTGETMKQLLMRPDSGYSNCHNVFLQALFDAGIVGLGVYLAALGLLVRPLMRTRNSFGGYILAAGFFAFMLILEVESVAWPYPFYLLFVLCYHAEAVVRSMDPGPEPAAA